MNSTPATATKLAIESTNYRFNLSAILKDHERALSKKGISKSFKFGNFLRSANVKSYLAQVPEGTLYCSVQPGVAWTYFTNDLIIHALFLDFLKIEEDSKIIKTVVEQFSLLSTTAASLQSENAALKAEIEEAKLILKETSTLLEKAEKERDRETRKREDITRRFYRERRHAFEFATERALSGISDPAGKGTVRRLMDKNFELNTRLIMGDLDRMNITTSLPTNNTVQRHVIP